MAAAESLILPTGEQFVFSEWGDFPVWSRVEFESGVTQDILAFNYTEAQPIPGGSSGAPATHYDTNMEEASQLPIDEVMIVMSIQIRFDESDSDHATHPGLVTLTDTAAMGMMKWRQLLEACTCTFTITNQKPMAEGPLDCFPFGGGMYFQHTTDSAAPDYAYYPQNGFATAEAARLLALPLRINTLQPFKARYRFPRGALPNVETTPTTSDDVYGLTMFLYGPRQRPVG